MKRRPKSAPALIALVAAALVPLAGCADANDAKPEEKTFAFTGTSLDVRSHGAPADLVATDRQDVKVTRWFDTSGKLGDAKESWTLDGGVLELKAGCNGFANCDTKYRIEVPTGVAVLRDGRQTDLKG